MGSSFRLLMTVDTKNNADDYYFTLINSLINNFNAEILLLFIDSKQKSDSYFKLENLKVNTVFCDAGTSDLYEDSYEFDCAINTAIKEFDPHVVHFNNFYKNMSQIKKPKILVNHMKFFKKDFKNKILQENFEVSDAIVATNYHSKFLIGEIYKPNKNINVILNGLNFIADEFVKNSSSITVSVGGFERKKSYYTLKNLAQKLPQGFKIKVIADEFYGYKMPYNVEFVNSCDSLNNSGIYNSYLFLSMCADEASYTSSLKAALSGSAIIADNTPINKEIWGDCACFYRSNDLNTLIRCINNLLENEKLLEQVSKNCKHKVLSTFNSKLMTYKYVNLYKQVLKSYLIKKNNDCSVKS